MNASRAKRSIVGLALAIGLSFTGWQNALAHGVQSSLTFQMNARLRRTADEIGTGGERSRYTFLLRSFEFVVRANVLNCGAVGDNVTLELPGVAQMFA